MTDNSILARAKVLVEEADRWMCLFKEHIILKKCTALLRDIIAALEGQDDVQQIILNLQLCCIGICSCDVKTPEVKHHFAHCRYRRIMEAADLIERQSLQLAEAEQRRVHVEAEWKKWAEEKLSALAEAERKLREANDLHTRLHNNQR